jgi:hypothetical protein
LRIQAEKQSNELKTKSPFSRLLSKYNAPCHTGNDVIANIYMQCTL